jgi:hypothetical protein
MDFDKRWIVRDRYGNDIYLTEERWEHIIDPDNHPEMEDCEENLKQTVRSGRRIQDSLNPQKYRYSKEFDDLDEENTHIVAIVLCRYWSGENGQPLPNNYIVTAYQKVMG